MKSLTTRIITGIRAVLPHRDLLPIEYYHGRSRLRRRRIDNTILELLPYLPTDPGVWYDGEGDPWVLGEDGRWTDADGVSRPVEHTPALVLFGPWAATPNTDGTAERTRE